jgi:hypothetical protein
MIASIYQNLIDGHKGFQVCIILCTLHSNSLTAIKAIIRAGGL